MKSMIDADRQVRQTLARLRAGNQDALVSWSDVDVLGLARLEVETVREALARHARIFETTEDGR